MFWTSLLDIPFEYPYQWSVENSVMGAVLLQEVELG